MYSIASVTISNFRLAEQVHLDLLHAGVVHVSGVNNDAPHASSNMAGKSTLLHAITWCLYECDTLGRNLFANVIRNGEAECSVTVRCVPDHAQGGAVEVTRTRTRKPRPGQPTVLLRVKQGDEVQEGPAEQTQKYVSGIFGHRDVFLAAHIFGYEEEYIPFARKSDRDKKDLFDLLLSTENLDRALDRAFEKRDRIRHLQTEVQNALRSRQSNLRILQQAAEEQETITPLEPLEEEIREIERLAQERHGALQNVELRRKEDEQIYHTLVKKWQAAENHIIMYATKRKALQDDMNTATNNLTELLENPPSCKLCGASLRAEAIREMVLSAKQFISATKKKLEEHLATQPPFSQEDVDAMKREAEIVEKRVRNYASSDSMLSKLRLEVASLTTQKYEKEQQLRKLRESQRKSQANSKSKIRAVTHHIQGLEDLMEEYEAQMELVKFWVTGFDYKGIRSYLLQQITPVLNKAARIYSNMLFGDGTYAEYATQVYTKAGEPRDAFDLSLYDVDHTKIEALSAGQAMRRDLIHLFSVVFLATKLRKRTLRFLAFDESFRTLDHAGVSATVQILHTLAKDTDTILVLEHNDEMASEFPTALVARRENGVTCYEYQHRK